MPTHEYYEELCALLPIGQLSGGEFADLSQHLKTCSSCRHAAEDFVVILDKMPIVESDVREKTLAALQRDSYRERFLKRAVADGVPFSDAVIQTQLSTRRRSTKVWPRLQLVPGLVAVAAAAIVVMCVQVIRSSRNPGPPLNAPKASVAMQTPTATRLDDQQVVADLEQRIAFLEATNAQDREYILSLRGQLAGSRQESASTAQQLSLATERLAQLEKEAGDAQLASKADLQRILSEKDNILTSLVAEQIKINDLMAQAREKEAIAERERELTDAAKDVRELMSARNLHILDVSDIDGKGRSKKWFGRVFLVEGKSLIFYAYDLGDRGNPAKVSFQAWGELEDGKTSATNLGVFYVDDHVQKRWVLKVDDPEKLKAISSVFVTVEPLGGTDRPTGKKFLFAYLGSRANHP